MSLNNNEVLISLWCDFEPNQKEWGNWKDFDFWKSARDLGYPQRSLEMAEKLNIIKNFYQAKITWGVFSCEPFFQWVDFLKDFLERSYKERDSITVHPHWLNWAKGEWSRCRAPNQNQVLTSLKTVQILSQYRNYCPLVRSGWNTQKMDIGTSLMEEYRYKYGFTGVGDVEKREGDKEYRRDGDFLIVPYDTDSMDNCVEKWKTYFNRVIKRAQRGGAIFSWWFHIHEINPDMFREVMEWTFDIAKKNKLTLKFINAGEMHKCLQ
ncbi:MAG: hypothetical protein HQK96_08270 [Nitrospirae bacterium]|nr:hypothetical protein [Nitrospirota bacterium]